METEFEQRADALRVDYEAKVAELKASLPTQIARRLAEGLIKNAGSSAAVAQLLASLPSVSALSSLQPASGNGSLTKNIAQPTTPTAAVHAPPAPVAAAAAVAPAPSAAPLAAAAAVADDETMVLEAYIDSARCTACNECTNLNNKMFAYNGDKQAYVKDPKAGTFQQLVIAAERCPVSIIHPGSPLNAKEKDLAKWVKRAEKFN
jgi:pyruvate-ferredoxin/flavodoxin oxidoreductase